MTVHQFPMSFATSVRLAALEIVALSPRRSSQILLREVHRRAGRAEEAARYAGAPRWMAVKYGDDLKDALCQRLSELNTPHPGSSAPVSDIREKRA